MDADLLAFVTSLDPKEAKDVAKEAGVTVEGQTAGKIGGRKKKRVTIKDAPLFTQTLEPTSMAGLADFASALEGDTGYAGLKKQLGVIAAGEDAKRLAQDVSGGKRKRSRRLEEAVPLVEEPLAKVHQDRVNREAAYQQTIREINKWQPIVQHNRQQKNLSFPLGAQAPGMTTAVLGAKADPRTDFEKAYQAALEAKGFATEGDIKRLEAMEANKLSVADVEKRFAELAKKRSLLFFTERKQKHQAKIKSKKYRKIKAKDRARSKAAEEAAQPAEERRMRAELARAKERLTLKTRKANKWAQEIIHRRHVDPNMHQEIVDQMRDKERLRQEIFGRAADLRSEDEDEENLMVSDPEERDRLTEEFFESDEDDHEDEEASDGSAEEYETASEGEDFDEENIQDPNAVVARKSFGDVKAVKEDTGDDLDDGFETVAAKKKAKASKAPSTNRDDLFKVATDEAVSKQQEIIRKAFAKDDLFADFEAEKDAVMSADAPQTVDLTLPGWGTWAGEGVALPKNPVKVVMKPKAGDGVQAKQRKDWGLKHVIFNERQNKKAVRLLTVQKVPYPYRSQEEYERAALGKPLGPEFNAASVYRKRIQPRVQVKMGSIIDPIKFHKQPKH